ncbi:MAG: glycosyltransferase family 2 protein [bacterium]
MLSELKKHNPLLFQASKKALWNYCLRQTSIEKFHKYIESYKNQNVKCVKRIISPDLPYNEPILVCAVKNDLHRVKMQIEHHKSIGITNFVYIDNMSDDGTFEWLLEQEIDVYRVDDKYHAAVRSAWIRQITDNYGYNRWYLILDSDELFTYPGMEIGKVKDLIAFAEKKKMNFVQSFMIDMYSKDKINSIISKDFDISKYDIKKNNCYFDIDSYIVKKGLRGKEIIGGPRSRIFSDSKEEFSPLLTKNPLVYLTKSDIYGTHYSMPYYKNFNNPVISGILHYKFLPTDGKKYVQIAKEGNYAGGSVEYKQYIKVIRSNPNLCFYYNSSQKFTSSEDLLKINIIDKKVSESLILEFDRFRD